MVLQGSRQLPGLPSLFTCPGLALFLDLLMFQSLTIGKLLQNFDRLVSSHQLLTTGGHVDREFVPLLVNAPGFIQQVACVVASSRELLHITLRGQLQRIHLFQRGCPVIEILFPLSDELRIGRQQARQLRANLIAQTLAILQQRLQSKDKAGHGGGWWLRVDGSETEQDAETNPCDLESFQKW